ncbi:unnamed protein product [Blepharisma stoltei]|uniref:Major facilitator superfamily (MFS) profile domain-containing protein n=1 Tax=Blepharisma stoltei TaxID=1481888 RepID=A0AAU9J278_9CILI|nr:unnamed protein product [Blepharisma stoltei]
MDLPKSYADEIYETKQLIKKLKNKPEPAEDSSWEQFKNSLRIIQHSEWELFSLFFINIMLSLDYYILTTMIPLYFSQQQGASDTGAGIVFGVVGIVVGILAIILGPFVNKLGCKQSLIISSGCTFIGYTLLLVTRNLAINLIGVICFLTVGCAMSWSVVELGAKLYTAKEARNTSNSLLMMGNFVSGILAGTAIDFIWTNNSNLNTTYFAIYSTAAIAAGLSLFIAISMRQPIENEEEEEEIAFTRDLYIKKKFWRFSALIGLLILLRSGCFGQLDATFPKYLTRQEGEKAHFGAYLALHSTTMLICTIGFTPLSYQFSSYSLILAGGFIGSISPLFLVIGGSNFYYICFVIVVSAGESLWVPRLLDYTMRIAPKGEEGTYLALCNCPFYFGMIVTGVFSGSLLEVYCPENGENNCEKMWLIIGVCGIMIPFLLVVLRKMLEQPDTEENPYISCVKEGNQNYDKVPIN